MKIDPAAALAAPVAAPQAGSAEDIQPSLQGAVGQLPDARSPPGCHLVVDRPESCDLLASLGF